MITTYKYNFRPLGCQEIELPEGAEILDIKQQSDSVYLWALVDTEREKVKRKFHMFATGESIDVDLINLNFVKTFHYHNNDVRQPFVFHAFEEVDSIPSLSITELRKDG